MLPESPLPNPPPESPRTFGSPTEHDRHSPSPGTPREGGGEGLSQFAPDPHPNPLPEYRARGPEGRKKRNAQVLIGALRWLPILFYLGAGLSFLLKGVGIAFILAGVAAFIVWSAAEGRDWRRCLRFLLSPAGLLLLAVLLVAWPAAAWHADPNIFKTFRKELDRPGFR